MSAHVLTLPPQAALHARMRTEPASVTPANRSVGRVTLAAHAQGGLTYRARVREEGALRVRFPPAADGELEAVMLNTAGGIAGGDRFEVEIHVSDGAHVVATSAAAEKVYRTLGPPARIDVRLTLESRAALSWIPQETILFDRPHLRRSLEADVAADASLLVFEALVLGRTASGEAVEQGHMEDRWRIRRDGRLVYADTLRLSGPIAELLGRPAITGGARAVAMLLYVAPDAETRLDSTRAIIDNAACSCGASAWNGMLAVRFLTDTIETLRREAVMFLSAFRGRPMPRVWQC